MISCYANTPFTHTFNVGLDGALAWTAQASVVTLDYAVIYDDFGTDFSQLNVSMGVSNSNLPNPNNFSVSVSANSDQTATYIIGGIDPQERVLILQTVFTSNTNLKIHANNVYLRVLNSTI